MLRVFVALGRRMCHQKCATLSPTRCTLDRRLSFSLTLSWAAANRTHRTSRTSWNWSSPLITACRGDSCEPVVGRHAYVTSITQRACSILSSIKRGNVCPLHCLKPPGKQRVSVFFARVLVVDGHACVSVCKWCVCVYFYIQATVCMLAGVAVCAQIPMYAYVYKFKIYSSNFETVLRLCTDINVCICIYRLRFILLILKH